MLRYSVVLVRGEEHGYAVTVPELPGCFTQGDTIEEALEHAKEAIEVHLEGFVIEGEPLPLEQEPPLLMQVEVDPDLSLAPASSSVQGQ
ncbi:MAG: type II toxin-antitoxin system HicB family antitoxin [Dehalococcoidia bacterium]